MVLLIIFLIVLIIFGYYLLVRSSIVKKGGFFNNSSLLELPQLDFLTVNGWRIKYSKNVKYELFHKDLGSITIEVDIIAKRNAESVITEEQLALAKEKTPDNANDNNNDKAKGNDNNNNSSNMEFVVKIGEKQSYLIAKRDNRVPDSYMVISALDIIDATAKTLILTFMTPSEDAYQKANAFLQSFWEKFTITNANNITERNEENSNHKADRGNSNSYYNLPFAYQRLITYLTYYFKRDRD